MAKGALRERLEARITSRQKELLIEAATVRGVSLSDFVVTSAQDEAVRVLEQNRILEVGRRDQAAFVEALLSPSEPNAALKRAAERYFAATR